MTSNNTKAKLNIAIILSGTFLVMLNQQLLSPALPAIMDEMGVGATTVQWLQSAYAMIIAILVPLSAFFLGKLSTRKLYILALVIFGIGSLLCAFAPAFGMILAGRMIQACSAGVLLPMCITMLMLSFPKEKRGTAMGVSIGALAGSQYMQVHLGFICMAVFALAYFLMMVVFVKEKR